MFIEVKGHLNLFENQILTFQQKIRPDIGLLKSEQAQSQSKQPVNWW